MNQTPIEMVKMLRAKAKDLIQAANIIESTFISGVTIPATPPIAVVPNPDPTLVSAVHPVSAVQLREPTVESVMGVLVGRSQRATDIARQIMAPVGSVERLIAANPTVFEVADRGWVKIRPQAG